VVGHRLRRLGAVLVAALTGAGVAPVVAAAAAGAAPVAPHLAAATVLGPLDSDQPIQVTVSLQSRDGVGLSALAAAVSDPGSPSYHRYLGVGAFADRFGASAATVAGLRSSLRRGGIADFHLAADGLSATVSTTAAKAQSFFHTRLESAQLASGRLAYANTTSALLPAGVNAVLGLQDVVEAHSDAVVNPAVTAANLPASPCSSALSPYVNTPAQVASAYGLDGLYSAGATGSGVTVGLFELADFSTSDISSYESCLGLPATTIDRVPVDGGAGVGTGTVETTADIEDLLTIAPGAGVKVYEGPNSQQGLYDTYAAMVNADQAKVLSTSWGICEAENSSSLMTSENQLFEQAAVQGQTVLAASGDSGSEDCYQSGTDANTSLQVDDPSSQPYVTGVGGTSLTSTGETVWNSLGGAGGGGISRVWKMPSWQQSSIYSASSGSACGNSAGDCRQDPDVSASADPSHGYAVYCTVGDCASSSTGASSGGWGSVGGTSMATPLWAGIVALSDSVCATSQAAGFINPVLYGSGRLAFNDITVGNNDLLGVHGGTYGARSGYDMASGLGSPDATLLAADLCAAAATNTSGGSGPTSTTSTSTTSTSTSTTSPTSTTTTSTTTTAPTGTGGPTTTTPPTTTPPPTTAPTAPASSLHGYRFVATDGGIFDFGGAGFYGSAGASPLSSPVVAMAVQPDQSGYWMVTSAGQVLTYGSAVGYGSLPVRPNSPVVAMSASPDGRGYFLATANGNVYSFGDAVFHGSAAGESLAAPVVGMATDPVTGGYWLVAADGGIFSYGAPFWGSTGAERLNQPIVGMTAMPDGNGYRFVAADGGIFDFGDAAFYGSAGNIRLNKAVVGMAATWDGRGYWLVAADGGIFSYGDAPFLGSTGAVKLSRPIVGMTGF
jgi:hypothetical protein